MSLSFRIFKNSVIIIIVDAFTEVIILIMIVFILSSFSILKLFTKFCIYMYSKQIDSSDWLLNYHITNYT